MSTLHELVAPWLLDDDSDDLLVLRDRIMWLKRHLFSEYYPDSYLQFDDRLVRWLQNIDDGPDRRAMFKLLGHLFFVAQPQFKALCRSAFNDAIARWLIDEAKISILDTGIIPKLMDAVKSTWFCSITDSMDVGLFLKVNGLAGHDLRTDWRSLELLGDPQALSKHIADNGIERIVFLEDFVGSGGQMSSPVIWARKKLPTIPMLVAPLICCPDGVNAGNILATHFNVVFAPTLEIRNDQFLLPDQQVGEPDVFGTVRGLIDRVKHRLGDKASEPFGHMQTGAIFSMFSNCPDNTLPIIHEQNDNWNALFPRVSREA